MNRLEIGQKLSDLILGVKIEGTVYAALSPQIELSQRYAIETEKGIIDTHVSVVENPIGFCVYSIRRPFRRGEKVRVRVMQSKPWVDGQVI